MEGPLDFGEEWEEEIFQEEILEKHSSEYWREVEKAGKACTLRFTTLEAMIRHILGNVPPDELGSTYKILPVNVSNVPQLKKMKDTKLEESSGESSGDWYSFRKVDTGKWILRGEYNKLAHKKCGVRSV